MRKSRRVTSSPDMGHRGEGECPQLWATRGRDFDYRAWTRACQEAQLRGISAAGDGCYRQPLLGRTSSISSWVDLLFERAALTDQSWSSWPCPRSMKQLLVAGIEEAWGLGEINPHHRSVHFARAHKERARRAQTSLHFPVRLFWVGHTRLGDQPTRTLPASQRRPAPISNSASDQRVKLQKVDRPRTLTSPTIFSHLSSTTTQH